MGKEWHENIPENGVLCKEKSSGSIIRIMGKSNLLDSMLMDDCRSRNHFGTDELTPLTAEEIWKLMPWQDIDSAPINTVIITMDNDGVVNPITLRGIAQCSFFKKWLPLPTDHN